MANRHGIERTVSRLAATVAVVVALGMPSAFLWHEFHQATAYLEAEAKVQAASMTAFVGRNPTAWRFSTERLRAVMEQSRVLKGATRVMDEKGQVLIDAEIPLEWPVLARKADFFDFGMRAGEVEVSTSGRDMFLHAAAVLAASIALGALIYGPLRRIPLRAFNAATEELNASEARHRALVERAAVGIVKHRHGSIEFANPAFVALVGAESAADVLGRDFLDFVAREHRGEAAGMIVTLSGGSAYQPLRRLRLCRRDGSIIETEVTGASHQERNAWVAQMIIVDVTGKRQAQDLVRQSRDRLMKQQRALSAIARDEKFVAGGDAAVRVLTEMAAQQMDVDRVSLWLLAPGREALQCVDLYERVSGRHGSEVVLPVGSCPRFVEAIWSEEVIVADDALSDRLTRELADTYLRPYGITSVLYVPVGLRGAPEAVLCHEHVGEAISWTLEQRMFAVAAGNLAALALERSAGEQAEQALRALRTTR